MLKRILVVGAVLGTSLFVVGAGAVLGVVLGTRTLVVSAAAVKPAAAISIVPASAPVVVALRDMAATASARSLDRALRCPVKTRRPRGRLPTDRLLPNEPGGLTRPRDACACAPEFDGPLPPSSGP